MKNTSSEHSGRKYNLMLERSNSVTGNLFCVNFVRTSGSDILVGMHGSGLTHVFILPDWAVLVELYDCGDPDCYQDLARLREIKYLGWTDKTKVFPEDEGHHSDLGAHEKFTNYKFDEEEFVKLIRKAAGPVKQHLAWGELKEHKTGKEEL